MSCVRIVVAPGEVDAASGELWAHDPVAVGEEVRVDGSVSLLAGFADAATAAQVAAALPTRWSPAVEAAPDEAAWRDAWRAHAEVVAVGRVRLWPSWWPGPDGEAADEAADGESVTVRLDPGWAFGSGSHPSTRMALAALQRHLGPAARVLDLGSGSGVLAVAAVLLGAGRVVAVDVDPEARRATAGNAEVNGVADRVTVTEAIPDGCPPFDLVVANIGAAVLADLAPVVVGAVAPGGVLVLGGLLAEQAPALAGTYRQVGAAAGVELAGISAAGTSAAGPVGWDEDGWATLVLARPGTHPADPADPAGPARPADGPGRPRRPGA
ncbi:MAG: 50S ribosomal protein L11 methyltransferase [Acidimicrobiia bacterium]